MNFPESTLGHAVNNYLTSFNAKPKATAQWIRGFAIAFGSAIIELRSLRYRRTKPGITSTSNESNS